ncbi:MAG: two pore domain potassium channel family protein [Planctomycetes bacterium]|nr:two pore domain potassium channel family protein [Planctomycetota bacterium]
MLGIFNKDRFIANKYFHLLVMLVISLAFAPEIEKGISKPGIHIITFTLMVTIILCLRVAVTNKKLFWICVSIEVVEYTVGRVASNISNAAIANPLSNINLLMSCCFIGMTIVLLMGSMFKKEKVDTDTILGGICVYLLIGVFWALVYICLNNLDNGIIKFDEGASLFYFSYSTLTTLGYGDIVPKGNFGMMLANFEAIAGQVYLTIFVARLVGLHIAEKTYALRKEGSGQKAENQQG